MEPIVEDVKKVSGAIVNLETSVKSMNTTTTIRFNKVVQSFGDAMDIVQKKERRRRKRNKDTILLALNNINAKLGIPQIGTQVENTDVASNL